MQLDRMKANGRSKSGVRWARIGGSRRRAMRRKIIERDGTACHHCGIETRDLPGVCGSESPPDQMTVDHFPVPRSKLPHSEWLNPDRGVIACLKCNTGRNEAGEA